MLLFQFINLIINCIYTIYTLANECSYQSSDFMNFNDKLIDITPVVIMMLIFTVGYITGITSYIFVFKNDDVEQTYNTIEEPEQDIL